MASVLPGETRDERRPHGEHADAPALTRDAKARLGLLALPTFALALAITIVSTYLGEVARRYTDQTVVIGAIVGSEGVMALWIPLIVGSWSDRLTTRLGGRLPFVLAGGIPAAVAVVLIGVLDTLGLIAAMAAVFFALYFVAYEPYRAMYPDLIEDEQAAGRAQSTQALARGLGTGSALLGGGLLLSVGRAAPFALAGFVLVIAISAFAWLIWRRRLISTDRAGSEHVPGVARRVVRLLRDHAALRGYFVANALWELALSALKSFVVLYLIVGLHYSLATSSLVIGAVALVILIGAGAAGKAGDRFGRLLIIKFALVAYGAGFLVPALTTNRPLIVAAMPFIALGGGTVMTLAYAILIPLMPENAHGTMTGFYSLSRGIGIVSGPVLAGAVISVSGSLFPATGGFQAMWLVCGLAAFASLPFVVYMTRAACDRQALRRRSRGRLRAAESQRSADLAGGAARTSARTGAGGEPPAKPGC